MRQSVRLGTLRGVTVGLHWSALVILVLLTQALAVSVLPATAGGYTVPAYWLAATGFASLFLAGLLAHEFAHALTAQHFGLRVRSITLWMLGGVTELEGEPPHPRADLLVALAGPAASLCVAGAFAALTGPAVLADSALLRTGFTWLAVVNVALAVFNLLPGTPLDGGRALAAIIWRVRGDRAQARRTAARAGLALGWIMVVGGLVLAFATQAMTGLWLMLLGWYLAGAARGEAARNTLIGALGPIPVGRLMSSPVVSGHAGQSVEAFIAGSAASDPHRCYPVLDVDGNLAGLVTVRSLAAVQPPLRGQVRLAELMIPVARTPVARPETPAGEAIALLSNPQRLIVVVDRRRPCGILTAGDLSRALDIAALGGDPRRSPAPEFVS